MLYYATPGLQPENQKMGQKYLRGGGKMLRKL